jgi:hypothetical protein
MGPSHKAFTKYLLRISLMAHGKEKQSTSAVSFFPRFTTLTYAGGSPSILYMSGDPSSLGPI